MEYKVIKTFKDKNSLKIHSAGSFYKTNDLDRASELAELGFIVVENVTIDNEDSKIAKLLELGVNELKKAITSDLGEDNLELLLKLETEGKNRKGVLDHIKYTFEEIK